MFKQKLKAVTDWLLLSRAGEILLILVMVLFCIAIAGSALLIEYSSDDYSRCQGRPVIDKTSNFIKL